MRRGHPGGLPQRGRQTRSCGYQSSQPSALKFTCPGTKRLKTFGVTGHAGFFAPQNYGDHRTAGAMSFPPPHLQQASGTVYAVCR